VRASAVAVRRDNGWVMVHRRASTVTLRQSWQSCARRPVSVSVGDTVRLCHADVIHVVCHNCTPVVLHVRPAPATRPSRSFCRSSTDRSLSSDVVYSVLMIVVSSETSCSVAIRSPSVRVSVSVWPVWSYLISSLRSASLRPPAVC